MAICAAQCWFVSRSRRARLPWICLTPKSFPPAAGWRIGGNRPHAKARLRSPAQCFSVVTGDDACARRLAGCRRRVSLALDLGNLLLHHGKPLDFPRDLADESRRQTITISGHELVHCQGFVLGFDVDAANALCEQQSLDSVDVRSPLADQPAPLTMRASQILVVDTWDAHQRPNMSLAPAPGDQRTQQHLDVDSVDLNSSPAPVYLEAARVDHKALDAAPHEEPRQPERVIAYFVADGDCWRRT